MAKFDDNTVFPFSDEDLIHLESEMKKYKVSLIYKWVFGSLYKWGKYFMPILFGVIFILGLIHNFGVVNLWGLVVGLSLFWIFFIGGAVVISWIAQRIKVHVWCKRLGITIEQWNLLTVIFQLKYV